MSARALLIRVESSVAGTRRAALLALWALVIVQVIWTVTFCIRTHPAFATVYYPVLFTPVAAALAFTSGRVRWIATLTRLLIGLAFFENVIDRLGVIGPPGAPGVSWGDFQHFIAYTAQVNAFAPAAFVPALAVLATIAEGSLAVVMLLGARVKLSSAGSALLLFTFATAMVLSGLSQLQYGVYLMSAAAWALATVDGSALSIDSVFAAPRSMAA